MDIIGYINFDNTGELPEIFNPSIFQSSSVVAINISSSNLSTSTLSVTGTGLYTGTTIPNSSTIATTQYVDEKIGSLINGSPEVLNTLSEFANAINNDPQIYDTITNNLSLKANSNNPVLTGTLLLNDIDLGSQVSDNTSNIIALVNKTSNIDNTSDINKPISSETQTALNLKANIDDPTFTTNITTPAMSLNGTDLNTRITTSESKITTLEGKTNAIVYNGTTNTTTINSKLVVSLDELTNGNTIIGNALTDNLTVNALSTFNNDINISTGKN
jgi:hypothetical protein